VKARYSAFDSAGRGVGTQGLQRGGLFAAFELQPCQHDGEVRLRRIQAQTLGQHGFGILIGMRLDEQHRQRLTRCFMGGIQSQGRPQGGACFDDAAHQFAAGVAALVLEGGH